MHIAHVNASTGYSGGEVQVFLLIEGLRKRGVACTLFAPPGSESLRFAADKGIDCHPLALRNGIDWPNMRRLERALRAGAFDLAHLHSGHAIWLGSLAARQAGLSIVATKRMDRRIAPGLKSWLIWRRLVDAAVAISPAVMAHFERAGVPTSRRHLICSVADPARTVPTLRREQVRADLNATAGTPILLTLGTLHRRKGNDVLIYVLHRLASEGVDFGCWIAGTGPERVALEQLAKSGAAASRINFLGHRQDAANLLHAADIVVVPSRAEGMGNAALEAMACGRPVLASAVGGLTHSVVDGVSGLLVPAEDELALAGGLRRLLADASLQERLGQAAQQRVRSHFHPDGMVDAYLALYGKLLATPHPFPLPQGERE